MICPVHYFNIIKIINYESLIFKYYIPCISVSFQLIPAAVYILTSLRPLKDKHEQHHEDGWCLNKNKHKLTAK